MGLLLPDFERPPHFEILAPVVGQERILGHEYEIVFLAPDIARHALPGQFMELLLDDSYTPHVRRPFSIYRADREAGTCSILYLARGSFTSALSQKRVGEFVSLLGPLGRPFLRPAAPETRHLLIAGGIGAPPLLFLARELCRERLASGRDIANICVLNGARTAEMLIGMVEFGELNVLVQAVTEDGSYGVQALVTDVLPALLDADPLSPTQIYACGPMPMLRAVSAIAIARGLPCQVSVETPMPCGIGICEGCPIAVQAPETSEGFRYARACWDGPVFEARDLVW